MLFVVTVVFMAALAVGYHRGSTAGFEAPFQFAGAYTTRHWYDWVFPFTGDRLWGTGWLGFFGPNTVRCLLAFFWGVVSLGVMALWLVWRSGNYFGFLIGMWSNLAGPASGAGPIGSTAGGLLPHSIFELPAFLLSWAFALRGGLVWIRPLPGLKRWPSFKRVAGDFRTSLALVIPLLLAAALLETYANPALRDRYLIGIGRQSGMASERRVGNPFAAEASAWSPDGSRLAAIDASRTGVWIRASDGSGRAELIAKAGDGAKFYDVFWSPDGKQIGTVQSAWAPGEQNGSALLIYDLISRKMQHLPAPGYWAFSHAAWDPQGKRIAAVFAMDIPGGRGRERNLWLFDFDKRQWSRITQFFPPRFGAAVGSGVSWRPDGGVIAFVRRLSYLDTSSPKQVSSPGCALCVVSPDGSGLREVTRTAVGGPVAWSPNAAWLAFTDIPKGSPRPTARLSDDEIGPSLVDLCLVRPDGADRRDGLARVDKLSSCSWSPDEKQIAYHRLMTCIIGAPRWRAD